ncbi:peroxisomal catalase 1-like [Brevipalpus obovatus]|uniref:peroxisomal catalase 1-like n=1 Tax=Brevipalpus obovatus TaxID=246614 RepID=UPI003D9DF745
MKVIIIIVSLIQSFITIPSTSAECSAGNGTAQEPLTLDILPLDEEYEPTQMPTTLDNNSLTRQSKIRAARAPKEPDSQGNPMPMRGLGFEGEEHFTDLGGAPVWNKINSLTAGKIGPQLLEDILFTEEMNHFNRERIPERVVHARGAGAIGYFEPTNPGGVGMYCKASVFSEQGKQFPVVVRFSTVIRSKGSADTVRDPRGFAVKIKTDDGNWDIVGLSLPVFFVRDPLRFMNFIHSQKPDPVTNTINYDSIWDFISLVPETFHAVSYLFTDLGTPDGYRYMHGFSIDTFKLINSEGKVTFGRFHLLSNQGVRNLTMLQATKIAGYNAEYATEDLFLAIQKGRFPSWTMYIQIMTQEQAKEWKYNPFDPTKIWPQQFPLIEAGRIVLNRNPRNFFAEIEQVAYNPANLVQGIEPSVDKLLQGRLFAYHDAHSYRLGPNHFKIPINRPLNLVTPTLRDGPWVFDKQFTEEPNYFPNSFGRSREDRTSRPSRWWLPSKVEISRFDTLEEDNYSQVGQFWESLSPRDRQNLIYNMAGHLSNAQKFIQTRVLDHIKKIHLDYYQSLRIALNKMRKP